MDPSIKENLLCHSRYIRDILAPIVAQKGGRLNEQQITALKAIFASLSSVRMTRQLLQYSRIEKALSIIAVEGNPWPVDTVLLSEALVNAWEDRIGPLRTIRADLWGPGGRLEGVMKLRTPAGDVSLGCSGTPYAAFRKTSGLMRPIAESVGVVRGECRKSLQSLQARTHRL